MPRCTKCKKPRDESDFSLRKGGKRRRICKACVREYSAGHYQQTKDRYVRSRHASKVAARARMRALVNEFKDRPCADCEERYPPYVMDLDHRDPRKKVFAIGRFSSSGVGEKRLLEELKKCDVVCANCHRERTYGA